MVVAGILIAGLLVATGWAAYRRPDRSATRMESPNSAAAPAAPAAPAVPAALDTAQIEAASGLAAQRLWRLAFGAPPQALPLAPGHGRVRDFICAVLEVDELNPNYFPRRPTLMPQLLQAVDDPSTASDKLSRMIAHDPVLTADVLRLANSSLYRTSTAPIETIQRAIVVCGVDALRGILATAMLRPVFRASRTNFPRLPRLLWDRTERAARAAELYAAKAHPQDRFEAQLVVLLSALGPLVVYGAALDGYSRSLKLTPDPSLFVELIGSLGPRISQRIARDWQTSARLTAVFERSGAETLTDALHIGELFGTLSLLESQTIITRDERLDAVNSASLHGEPFDEIWARLAAGVEKREQAIESH
jgi:HDOD domain